MTEFSEFNVADYLDNKEVLEEYLKLKDDRIAELEAALDAFHKDPENPDAAVLRYKAIASKAINEQVEIRKEYEARIAELEAALGLFIAYEETDDEDGSSMIVRYDEAIRAARAALEKTL